MTTHFLSLAHSEFRSSPTGLAGSADSGPGFTTHRLELATATRCNRAPRRWSSWPCLGNIVFVIGPVLRVTVGGMH